MGRSITTEAAADAQDGSGHTAAESEGLYDLIASLTAAVADASLSILVRHRLSLLEYGILDRCRRGEAHSVTKLAEVFPVDTSAMSRQVSKLVDRGLLRRRRLPSDRRTVRLSLTEKGRSLALVLAEELRARRSLLMKGISDDERAVFMAAAHKMLANLEDTPSAETEPRS